MKKPQKTANAPADTTAATRALALFRSLDEDEQHISLRQIAVLGYVSLHPGQSVRDAADFLNMSKPAVTRAVDALQQLRLATRRDSKDDRRLVMLSATPDGNLFLQQIMGAVVAAA
jgi:DNA-binding MarR family transcriptional regulator